MANNRKEHLRYRYGICLNDSCPKCKSKEVQQIPARKEFECEECHKPLRECPPPKTFWDKYGKIIISAAVAVIAAIIIVLCFNTESGSDEKPVGKNGQTEQTTAPGNEKATETDSLSQKIDSTKVEAKATKVEETNDNKEINKKTKPGDDTKRPEPKSSITVPFGTYSGPANGLDGEIKVTRAYSLDLRNSAHEKLELLPGDVITRTKFKDGELVGGYWKRGSETRTFHR